MSHTNSVRTCFLLGVSYDRRMDAPQKDLYDVVIVGAGASGSALFYSLARYTTIQNILIIEKYATPGSVNSAAHNNSQTLHVGDIETNYSVEKSKQVRPAALMVKRYTDLLPESKRGPIISKVQKMVIGIGSEQVKFLQQRFELLKDIYPDIVYLDRDDIAVVEPLVIMGRPKSELISALASKEGYAVDFQKLSKSFIDEAHAVNDNRVESLFNSKVTTIELLNDIYHIKLSSGVLIKSRTVVVNADSYSLLFAKQLGYGHKYSLIPIAGSFYFSKENVLKGKVYTVQDPKLPFAAVHGDPDIRVSGKTRFGPTARFFPVLEARNRSTFVDFLKSSGLNRFRTWASFTKILLDPTRFLYLLENMLYELPIIGKMIFIKNVRRIIPTIKAKDIDMISGYGGMRLQRVDTEKGELQLGEGKIIEKNIIFNMTPSPGASVCLYNAMRDTELLVGMLKGSASFDKTKMMHDLINENTSEMPQPIEVSMPHAYVS